MPVLIQIQGILSLLLGHQEAFQSQPIHSEPAWIEPGNGQLTIMNYENLI